MQKNQLIYHESILVQIRIRELTCRLCNMKKRFQYFSRKYEVERRRVHDLVVKSKILSQRIDKICQNMLAITLNSTEKSDAVILAILENMFAEKRDLQNLLDFIIIPYEYAEELFSKFQFTLSNISHDNFSNATILAAESMLPRLSTQVVFINDLVSRIHEKSFQFVCIFEEALTKIKIVFRKASKRDKGLKLMKRLFTL